MFNSNQGNNNYTIKIDGFKTIKNYPAGKDGNMLVSLDENLVIAFLDANTRRQVTVKPMIVTVYIDDPDDQDLLSGYVDTDTPCDRVIVVNKKFMRLLNSYQLAILEAQNAMADVTGSVSVLEASSVYGYACAARSHPIVASHALKIRDDTIRKQSIRLGKKARRSEKKGSDASIKFTSPGRININGGMRPAPGSNPNPAGTGNPNPAPAP